jgi:hypothetical protein
MDGRGKARLNGLVINKDKSSTMFSKGTSIRVKEAVIGVLASRMNQEMRDT